MKKLLSLIFAMLICIPAHADTYNECANKVKQKYNLLYDFENDSDYKKIYKDLANAEADKLNAWKEQVRTSDTGSGTHCNNVPYECKTGQKNKDCVPQGCWTLMAQIKEGLFLEQAAKQQFENQKINEQCGNSTTANPSTSQKTQNITITVTVWDANANESAIGATVMQKGTSNGAVTDINGIAKLTVPANATIVVSYVGKETMEQPARANMRFELKDSSMQLDEVVVKACSLANGIKTTACENCTDPDRCSISQCSGTCVVKECYTPCYELKNNKCEQQKNPKGGTYTFANKQCTISCNSGYKLSDNKCSRDCLTDAQKTDPLAKKAEYDDKNVCQITDCNSKDGKKYVVVDNKCVEKERDCTDAELQAMNIPGATAGTWSSKKGACTPTACAEPQYEAKPKGGKCVSVDDSNCDTKPENSKKSHQKYDESTNTVQCIVDECSDGYRVADDGLSCVLEKALSKEDAEKRMQELKDNAQAMKDREQSTENKLLGAAGIGAVGIGGMNIASALAEKSADADAEEDMKAYLATFRCDYGQGRNIVGGELGIELPGGNDLLTYTTEYKQLAQNLKIDKEALGMTPGIESEVVFDKAETGLYDNVGIGTQPGAFTSLSRALLDENGADAKAWAEQKDATASKLKTGLIVAGVGAVGTLAGNLAINHGKDDQSGEIMQKYEGKKINITPNKIPCSQISGTTGSGYSPNCQCSGTNVYFSEHDGCVQCDTNAHMVVSADRTACECDSANGYLPVENDPTRCEKPQTPQPENNTCKNITGYYNPQTCECYPNTIPQSNINRETVCSCDTTNTQRWNALSKTCEKCNKTGDLHPTNYCECADGATQNGNECRKSEQQTEPEDNSVVFNVDASGTFKPGKDEFETGVCDNIISQMTNNNDYKQQFNTWQSGTDKNVYVQITGHTDFQGFKANTGKNKRELDRKSNEALSKRRAEHMKTCIENHKSTLFGNTSVQPQYKPDPTGKGWDACDAGEGTGVYPTKTSRDQAQCRQVEVIITFGQPKTGVKNIIQQVASQIKI
ncbi:MAG: carboxypeptidase-like regulatory domain-containing protein [Muribaculaceae bacterium]|nr:carboxypeptidase-like regulatory domain-containing protein [Muribaculaceae bacterium]